MARLQTIWPNRQLRSMEPQPDRRLGNERLLAIVALVELAVCIATVAIVVPSLVLAL